MTLILLIITLVLLAAVLVVQLVILRRRPAAAAVLAGDIAAATVAGKRTRFLFRKSKDKDRTSNPLAAGGVQTESRRRRWPSWFRRKEEEEPVPEPPVTLDAQERDPESREWLGRAKEQQGFLTARWILADALLRHSEILSLDFTGESVGVRYLVEGLWHDGSARDRESSMAALAA